MQTFAVQASILVTVVKPDIAKELVSFVGNISVCDEEIEKKGFLKAVRHKVKNAIRRQFREEQNRTVTDADIKRCVWDEIK